MRTKLLPLAVALALGACSFIPEYQRPAAPVPDAWPALQPAAALGDSGRVPTKLEWREYFPDPRLQALIAATRDGRWFALGLSPRAGLSLLKLARARALVLGRGHVSPEDLQVLWVPTVAHRLQPLPQSGRSAAAQARALLEAVPVP